MLFTFQISKDGVSFACMSFEKDIIKIGRLPSSDLHFDHDAVARMHAVIERSTDDGLVRAIDLGSNTGTMVNGHRIGARSHTLASGDVVGVGPYEIHVTYNPTGHIRAYASSQTVPPPIDLDEHRSKREERQVKVDIAEALLRHGVPIAAATDVADMLWTFVKEVNLAQELAVWTATHVLATSVRPKLDPGQIGTIASLIALDKTRTYAEERMLELLAQSDHKRLARVLTLAREGKWTQMLATIREGTL